MSMEFSPTDLPRYIAIKGDNGKYLALDYQGGLPMLTFTADSITTMSAHEVLYNTDDDAFIIRSQASGYYWTRDQYDNVFASLEDVPAATDTRSHFTVVQVNPPDTTLAFRSQSDPQSYLMRADDGGTNMYVASASDTTDSTCHIVVSDASSYVIQIPPYVVLSVQGDYLNVGTETSDHTTGYLTFDSNQAPTDLSYAYTLIPQVNGFVKIAPAKFPTFRLYYNSFAVSAADSIASDIAAQSGDQYLLDRLGSNMVTLQGKAGDDVDVFLNQFMKRIPSPTAEVSSTDLVAIGSDSTDEATHFTMTPAIINFQVFDVVYLLNQAQVSSQELLEVGYGSATNDTEKKATMTVSVTVTQDVSTSSTFTCSLGTTENVSTTIEAGIPEIAEDDTTIEVGMTQTLDTEWGETMTQEVSFQTQYEVTVEPGTTAEVVVTLTTAQLNVPFSYSQITTLIDNTQQNSTNNIDGIYQGVTAYDINATITDSNGKTTLAATRMKSKRKTTVRTAAK